MNASPPSTDGDREAVAGGGGADDGRAPTAFDPPPVAGVSRWNTGPVGVPGPSGAVALRSTGRSVAVTSISACVVPTVGALRSATIPVPGRTAIRNVSGVGVPYRAVRQPRRTVRRCVAPAGRPVVVQCSVTGR